MIIKSFYRLSEYKIIEDESGALWWEAHAGIGAIKHGKCFIKGDILFIQAGKIEESGFLKREFLDKLKSLPVWEKTQYYCLSPDIRSSRSVRKLTQEEMQNWRQERFSSSEKRNLLRDSIKKDNQSAGLDQTEKVSYKLGNYEIVEKANGQLWWRSHSGYNRLREGKCIVAEDILFIGMKEKETSDHFRNRFLEYLKDLPIWGATQYYCPNGVLFDCRIGKNLLKEQGGVLHTQFPHTSGKRFFTPTSRTTLSYSSSPDHWRHTLIDSSVSFLKQIAQKVGNGVEQKAKSKSLENKDVQRCGTIKSVIRATKVFLHMVRGKKWIAFIGAFIIIITGILSLILIHNYRDSWDEHQNHHRYRSFSHHRDH